MPSLSEADLTMWPFLAVVGLLDISMLCSTVDITDGAILLPIRLLLTLLLPGSLPLNRELLNKFVKDDPSEEPRMCFRLALGAMLIPLPLSLPFGVKEVVLRRFWLRTYLASADFSSSFRCKAARATFLSFLVICQAKKIYLNQEQLILK